MRYLFLLCMSSCDTCFCYVWAHAIPVLFVGITCICWDKVKTDKGLGEVWRVITFSRGLWVSHVPTLSGIGLVAEICKTHKWIRMFASLPLMLKTSLPCKLACVDWFLRGFGTADCTRLSSRELPFRWVLNWCYLHAIWQKWASSDNTKKLSIKHVGQLSQVSDRLRTLILAYFSVISRTLVRFC